jgi:hypothetical protein
MVCNEQDVIVPQNESPWFREDISHLPAQLVKMYFLYFSLDSFNFYYIQIYFFSERLFI